MEWYGVSENILGRKINRKLESAKRFRTEN